MIVIGRSFQTKTPAKVMVTDGTDGSFNLQLQQLIFAVLASARIQTTHTYCYDKLAVYTCFSKHIVFPQSGGFADDPSQFTGHWTVGKRNKEITLKVTLQNEILHDNNSTMPV
jgi:hypothetical protein